MNIDEFTALAKNYDTDLFLGGFSGARYSKPEALEREVRHEIEMARHGTNCPATGCRVLAIAGATTMGIGAIYGMKDLGADTAGLVSSEAKKYPEDLAKGVPILFVDRPKDDWSVGGVNITIAKELQRVGKNVEAIYFNGGKVSGAEIREYADNGIPTKINNHPDLTPLREGVLTVQQMWESGTAPLDVRNNISMGSTLTRASLNLKKSQEGDSAGKDTGLDKGKVN